MDQPCGFLADQQLPAPVPAPLPDPVPLASTAVTLKIAGSAASDASGAAGTAERGYQLQQQ